MKRNNQLIKSYTTSRHLNDFQKKEKRIKIIFFTLAILFIITGIIFLLIGLNTKPGMMIKEIFVSSTPTPVPTDTPTPTQEYTATFTPSPTPAFTSTPEPTATPSGPRLYTVEEGDNCWYISVEKFNVSFDTFMAINNLKECNISPGDQLIIPVPGKLLPTSTPVDLSAFTAGQTIEYSVETNDTYKSIADKFNTTVEILKQDNNITTDDFAPRIGTVLTITVNKK